MSASKAVLGALGQEDPDQRGPDATPVLVAQKRCTDSAAETEGLLGSPEGRSGNVPSGHGSVDSWLNCVMIYSQAREMWQSRG